MDGRPEYAHAENIESLAAGILRAHVHLARQPKQGAGGCGGHAMLTRAGFGDDPLFAHAFGQQSLPDGVVDFVSTGVGQIFPLQKDGGPSCGTGQLGARGKRCGSTDVILQKPIQLGPKSFVCQCFLESAVEFFKGWYQRLGNVASAEFPKSSGGIRLGWRELRNDVVYSRLFFPKMRRRKSRQRSLACAPCFPNPMCSFGAPV